jgi:hypothetical protein
MRVARPRGLPRRDIAAGRYLLFISLYQIKYPKNAEICG